MSETSIKDYAIPTTPKWTDDFNATFDPNSGDWSGTHSYHIAKENVKSTLLELGDPCTVTDFSFMKFVGAQVANQSGGIWQVRCSFAGNEDLNNSADEFTSDEAMSDDNWRVVIRIGLEKASIPAITNTLADDPDPLIAAKAELIEMYNRGDIRFKATEGSRDIYLDVSQSGDGNIYWIDNEASPESAEGRIKATLDLMRSGMSHFDQPRIVINCFREGMKKGLKEQLKNVGKIWDKGPINNKDIPDLDTDYYWILQGCTQDPYIDSEGDDRYRVELEFWSAYVPPNAKPLFEAIT